MKKNKKKKMFTKVERFLYKFSLMIIVFLVIGTIFGQTMLSKVNYEVEKLKNNLDEEDTVYVTKTILDEIVPVVGDATKIIKSDIYA